MEYKFVFNNKEYALNKNNLKYFINDDENELQDINEEKILQILHNSRDIELEKSYYDKCCEICREGKDQKKKVFDFLEFYFYAYGKDNRFVTSSIDNNYAGKSFTRLMREGIVDTSYIVTIIVCKHCGSYSIEIEEFEL